MKKYKMKKKSILCLACLCGITVFAQTEQTFTDGVFIVNEDWYGHQNSSINWLSTQGDWTYNAFRKVNPGHELGCTSQFGCIYGGKLFICSKQDKDPGATVHGSRLVICDAQTLKVEKEFRYIAYTVENGDTLSIGDTRAILPVNNQKAYISTSNGIWTFDRVGMSIGWQIKGTENPNDDGYGSLYYAQAGNMLRENDLVYAVHQQNGLLFIDPEKDEVVRTIQAPYEKGTQRGFGSIVMAKDGSLWLSVCSDQTGSGSAEPYLMKVDANTGDTLRVVIPEQTDEGAPLFPPSNSWYAWTADGFCASNQQNCIYWQGSEGSWFSKTHIYCYHIDTGKFSLIIDTNEEGWNLYGAGFRIHPVTDEIYAFFYHTTMDPTYQLVRMDRTGKILKAYSMIENYWFPALPVFPDNYAPQLKEMSDVELTVGEDKTVDLAGTVSDIDNMEAAIVKQVTAVSDPETVSASIVSGNLQLVGLRKGNALVEITYNSNGQTVSRSLPVAVSTDNGLNVPSTMNTTDGNIYTLQGQLVAPSGTDLRTLPKGIYLQNGKKIIR